MPKVEQAVALASVMCAIVTVLMTARRDRGVERERQRAEDEKTRADAARHQMVDDKLNRIFDCSAETSSTLKEINRKLDDHGQRITKVENDVENIYRRVGRLEDQHDSREGFSHGD